MRALTISVVCLVLLTATATAQYDSLTFVGCGSNTLRVGQNGQQKQGTVMFNTLDNYGASSYPLNCSYALRLETKPGYRLTLKFTKLRLKECGSPRRANVNVAGETNSLEYCGWYTNYPSMYSSANYLNITFFHGHTYPSDWSGEAVEFYYTAYHTDTCNSDDNSDDDDDDDDDHDDDEEFKCYSGRCIDKDVICDGYDNCGDWSDEWMYTCGLTSGVIIAIAVTCSLLGVCLIACIAYTCVRKQKRNKTADAAAAATTTRRRSTVNSSQVDVEPDVNDLRYTVPAPPPYTYINTMVVFGGGCDIDGGGAAPYGGPPMYDEIDHDKKTKHDNNE